MQYIHTCTCIHAVAQREYPRVQPPANICIQPRIPPVHACGGVICTPSAACCIYTYVCNAGLQQHVGLVDHAPRARHPCQALYVPAQGELSHCCLWEHTAANIAQVSMWALCAQHPCFRGRLAEGSQCKMSRDGNSACELSLRVRAEPRGGGSAHLLGTEAALLPELEAVLEGGRGLVEAAGWGLVEVARSAVPSEKRKNSLRACVRGCVVSVSLRACMRVFV